ncbi:MAG: phycobilisome rod-core linker polypeptide CpcG [Leptolyngbya sp. SIO4C1]|nr:phycobilisome rod-core linker polypeptide CpcG [Leptolyngbya sp. SIO4C1]
MSISTLPYRPTAQNQRVNGYEVPGEEQPRVYSTEQLLASQEMDALIYAAYRQIFNEQQLVTFNRQPLLESQLRNNQITVRDFIRGLATSDSFRRWVYDANNNYRFVQLCIQRLLGRDIYSYQEVLSWSIILATKGISGFVDALLSSEEYLENFGDDTVPYQRRRILPQRATGDLPFARMARYGESYREQVVALSNRALNQVQKFQRPTSPLVYVGGSLVVFGCLYLVMLTRISALS